jgi:hypothetical protein
MRLSQLVWTSAVSTSIRTQIISRCHISHPFMSSALRSSAHNGDVSKSVIYSILPEILNNYEINLQLCTQLLYEKIQHDINKNGAQPQTPPSEILKRIELLYMPIFLYIHSLLASMTAKRPLFIGISAPQVCSPVCLSVCLSKSINLFVCLSVCRFGCILFPSYSICVCC